MAVAHPWLLALCITSLLMALGVASGLVNTRLWVSEPLACVAVGILLGPVGLGLVRLDVGSNPDASAFLREAARVTLAVSVTAAGMRLSRGWLKRNWRGLAVALGPGMLAMWLVGSATAALLGLPWATCLLLGAVLTPTDPVLSAPDRNRSPRPNSRTFGSAGRHHCRKRCKRWVGCAADQPVASVGAA